MFIIQDKRKEILTVGDMVKCYWLDFTSFVGVVERFDQPTFNRMSRRILVRGLDDRRTGWFEAKNVLKMNDGEKMLYQLEQ